MREAHFRIRWELALALAVFMAASSAGDAASQTSGGKNRPATPDAGDGIRLDAHFWDESAVVSLLRGARFSIEGRIPRGWTVDGEQARLLPPARFRDVCGVRYALEPGIYRERLPILIAADQQNARRRYQSAVVRSAGRERVDVKYIDSSEQRVSRSYFETGSAGEAGFLVIETRATADPDGLACGKAADTIVDNLKVTTARDANQ